MLWCVRKLLSVVSVVVVGFGTKAIVVVVLVESMVCWWGGKGLT